MNARENRRAYAETPRAQAQLVLSRVASDVRESATKAGANPSCELVGRPSRSAFSVFCAGPDRKITWVREIARTRLDDLELGVTVAFVIESDDRVAIAESIASGLPQVDGRPADPRSVLVSPHVLIGTIDEMTTTLQHVATDGDSPT
jgi:hypothetical protein